MNSKLIGIFVMMLLCITSLNFLGIADATISNEDKLLKIKQAIEENNAQWNAGFNTVFTESGDNLEYLLGCIEEKT